MNKILCSTGAVIVRANGRDYTLLTACANRLDCDGFEFLMYGTWYDKIDEIAAYIADLSKPVPVFHIEKQVGELISRNMGGDTEKALELFEINCSLAKKIGASKVVLHLWSGLDSDKDIAHNIDIYRYVRAMADQFGLVLSIENVVCNHLDPMSHLFSLAKAYPDIQFTFDTKMAEFHNQLDLLFAPENRWIFGHICHMHINDYKGGYKDWGNLRTLHIGDGQINFDKLFTHIKDSGYRGDFTVEATSVDDAGKIDFDALNRSFRMIREYL